MMFYMILILSLSYDLELDTSQNTSFQRDWELRKISQILYTLEDWGRRIKMDYKFIWNYKVIRASLKLSRKHIWGYSLVVYHVTSIGETLYKIHKNIHIAHLLKTTGNQPFLYMCQHYIQQERMWLTHHHQQIMISYSYLNVWSYPYQTRIITREKILDNIKVI